MQYQRSTNNNLLRYEARTHNLHANATKAANYNNELYISCVLVSAAQCVFLNSEAAAVNRTKTHACNFDASNWNNVSPERQRESAVCQPCPAQKQKGSCGWHQSLLSADSPQPMCRYGCWCAWRWLNFTPDGENEEPTSNFKGFGANALYMAKQQVMTRFVLRILVQLKS